MSNLNIILVQLQRGQFATAAGDEVFYSDCGNLAFDPALQCIQSYHHEFMAGAQLDAGHGKCNASMRGARIAVEKNYNMVSSLYCICASTEGYKIAEKSPVILEQL
jgi:hypothetical protein